MRLIFRILSSLLLSVIFFHDILAKNLDSRLSIGAGYYNFLKNGYLEEQYGVPGGVFQSTNSRDSLAYNLELYPSSKYKVFGFLQPNFGFIGTHQESFYSYLGLGADLYFGRKKNVVLYPNFAVGYMAGDQNDIQLGFPLEFKSGIDFLYRFRNEVRIGAGVYHISNAALGEHNTHGTRNPGTEILMLKYQIPF